MQITIDHTEFVLLSAACRAELVAFLGSLADPPTRVDYSGFIMDDVVDLDEAQMRLWMRGVRASTRDGLRLFAVHGPIVPVSLLFDAGIANYGHFQSRTTMRTRTVTGRENAYLLAWDKWEFHENAPPTGRYAIPEKTLQSLRKFFAM